LGIWPFSAPATKPGFQPLHYSARSRTSPMTRAFALVFLCALAACRDSLAPADPTPVAAMGRHASVVTPSGVEYTAIDLGALPNGNAGARAINALGQIAGSSSLGGQHFHAVFWDVDGVIRDLGTLGGARSTGAGINASGNVVGWSRMTDEVTFHGFVWKGDGMIDLGTLNGDPHSLAEAVNDDGIVVGSSYSEDFALATPFKWKDGTLTALGTLGGFDSYQWAINSSAVSAGYSYNAEGEQRAVIWSTTTPTDLGAPAGSMFSEAVLINDAGQVAGYFFTPAGDAHAFRWENDVLTDLGSFGAWGTIPWGMNARGDVVGATLSPDGQSSRAFLWRDGIMRDLGTLPGYQHAHAYGINDKGQIAGCAWNNFPGLTRGFIWENGVMIELPLLPNTDNSCVSDWRSINNRGQIIGGGGLTASNNGRAILWQPSDPVTTVLLDIKPGTTPNVISLASNGMIPVAILSTTEFDASTVDVASLRFGPTGAVEAHGIGHPEDANGDGIADLVLHFAVKASGISCGQSSVTLIGKTSAGREIRGSDSVMTNRCH
jgi:probable HAF family extracellular repeat protein